MRARTLAHRALLFLFSCRTVYYREHAAGIYGVLPYSMAEILIEVPYITVMCLVYSVIVYFWIGFIADAAKFFYFFLFMVWRPGRAAWSHPYPGGAVPASYAQHCMCPCHRAHCSPGSSRFTCCVRPQWLTLVYFVMFGMLCVHVTPTLQLASAMSTALFGIFNIFCVSACPPLAGLQLRVLPAACERGRRRSGALPAGC